MPVSAWRRGTPPGTPPDRNVGPMHPRAGDRRSLLTALTTDHALALSEAIRLMAAARTREALWSSALDTILNTRLLRCELPAEIPHGLWLGGFVRLHQDNHDLASSEVSSAQAFTLISPSETLATCPSLTTAGVHEWKFGLLRTLQESMEAPSLCFYSTGGTPSIIPNKWSCPRSHP